MKADIDNTVKKLFDLSSISVDTAKGKCNPHQIPGKPYRAIVADLFTINNCNVLCVVDHHRKSLS